MVGVKLRLSAGFKAFLFLIVTTLTGCASAHQYVPLPNQDVDVEQVALSRVYVLRPSTLGAALKLTIRDEIRDVGKTGAKSFLCWERRPGQATIIGEAENRSSVLLDLEAGKRYYVKQGIRMGVMMARNELEVLDDEEGRRLLSKCRKPAVKTDKAPPLPEKV